MLRLIFVAVLMVLPAATAAAQAAVQIAAGERVRVKAAGSRPQIVTVVDVGAGSIAGVSGGRSVTLELSSIERMERSVGDRSRGDGLVRGLGRGFLVGGVGGALLGAASGTPGCTSWDMTCYSREEGALGFSVIFGAAGALVGGFMGMASPGEQWQRVAVPARLAVTPTGSGGGAVRLSLDF
jgi:hypothetical protein